MRLSCLETFPSLLVENEVWTASSPDVWGRPTERRGRKQKQEGVGGRTTWGSVQSEAPMCESLSDEFVHVKLSLVRSSPRGPGVGGPPAPAVTPNSSPSDPDGTPRPHAALQRHTRRRRKPSAIIRGQRRFNTVRSRSGEAGQRSTSGGHEHFHTQRRSSQGKYPHVTTNTWLQLLLLLLHSS